MLADVAAQHVRIELVASRGEMKIVGEEQRRWCRVVPERPGRVHEWNPMFARKGRELSEWTIVQMHDVPADAVLIADRRQCGGIGRNLPGLWVRCEQQGDAVVVQKS